MTSDGSMCMPREGWDEYFMNTAYHVASRATCPRLQVGAVLVKDKRIKATGYNGAPPGKLHCIDVGCRMVDGHCTRTTHAEINMLNDTSWWERCGGTIYCTDVPCWDCALRVIDSGVAEWVYARNYRNYDEKIRPLFEWHGIVLRQYVPNLLLKEG